MYTSPTFKAAIICAAAFCGAIGASRVLAQDQTAAPKQCPVDPASPAHAVYVPDTQDCSEVVKAFKRAQEQFFIGECATLDARRNAGDPKNRKAANDALQKAAAAFKESSEAYAAVAKFADASVALPDNQDAGAREILRVFGFVPKTYKESFGYLSKVLAEAADELADMSIGEDGDPLRVRAAASTITGPLVKPGILFRALFVWGVNQA